MAVKMYKIGDTGEVVAAEIVPPEESNSRVAAGWVFSPEDVKEKPTNNLIAETEKIVVEEAIEEVSEITEPKAEDIVQIKNPKTGKYTKIDRATGTILSHKKTAGAYVNIPIIETEET